MSEAAGLIQLVGVATGNHGFITTETAAAAGVDPARLPVMLARGQLERFGRSLYRIPQLPIGEHDDLTGAVMRVGHGAVVSHGSALFLHGLTDAQPAIIEVTVPAAARVRRGGLDGIKVSRANLTPEDLVSIEGIATTTISRTRSDCLAAGNRPTQSTLLSANLAVDRTGHALVELIDGKALYDGRSLIAWASRVADRIVELCPVTRVVLYGSVARGDDGPDSDIDLLVVTPIIGRRHDTTVRLLNELRDFPVPVDITVVDPERLDEEASVPGVVRVAMREGRVLVAGQVLDAVRSRMTTE